MGGTLGKKPPSKSNSKRNSLSSTGTSSPTSKPSAPSCAAAADVVKANSEGSSSSSSSAPLEPISRGPASLPDILSNAKHIKENHNRDSLSGFLDTFKALAVQSPAGKEAGAEQQQRSQLIVPPLVGAHHNDGSYTSSDDEAFVECDSFADESALLRGDTICVGSDEDLHAILNDSELLEDTRMLTPAGSDESINVTDAAAAAAAQNDNAEARGAAGAASADQAHDRRHVLGSLDINESPNAAGAVPYGGNSTMFRTFSTGDTVLHRTNAAGADGLEESGAAAALRIDGAEAGAVVAHVNTTIVGIPLDQTIDLGEDGDIMVDNRNDANTLAMPIGLDQTLAVDGMMEYSINIAPGAEANASAAASAADPDYGSTGAGAAAVVNDVVPENNAVHNVTHEAAVEAAEDIDAAVNNETIDAGAGAVGHDLDKNMDIHNATIDINVQPASNVSYNRMNDTINVSIVADEEAAPTTEPDGAYRIVHDLHAGPVIVASPQAILGDEIAPVEITTRPNHQQQPQQHVNETAPEPETVPAVVLSRSTTPVPQDNAPPSERPRISGRCSDINSVAVVLNPFCAPVADEPPAERSSAAADQPNYDDIDADMDPTFAVMAAAAAVQPAEEEPVAVALAPPPRNCPTSLEPANDDDEDEPMDFDGYDDEQEAPGFGADFQIPAGGFKFDLVSPPLRQSQPLRPPFFAKAAVPQQAAAAAAMGDNHEAVDEAQFEGNNMILQNSDFEALLASQNNNPNAAAAAAVVGGAGAGIDGATAEANGNQSVATNCRESLLLRFDPLSGRQSTHLGPFKSNLQLLAQTGEDELATLAERSMQEERDRTANQSAADDDAAEEGAQGPSGVIHPGQRAGDANMSVGLIQDIKTDEGDVKPSFVSSNNVGDKTDAEAAEEFVGKIECELLNIEDADKKLREAEMREEAYIRRISEKDKIIAKMNVVMESYEKTISELGADKELATRTYSIQNSELKIASDANLKHLTSLESTFSDLHAKYERSKQTVTQLHENEELMRVDIEKFKEQIKAQEQRYEKMKQHAIAQLEIANSKLETMTRTHHTNSSKLRVSLKREEIARTALEEQLKQKIKENAELMKICDELISSQGS